MSYYDYSRHAMMPSPTAKMPGALASAAPAAAQAEGVKDSADGESFLDHVWDVINPLQHLPVVGTVYRAITGDHIGTVEKIAGDTLYGGMWGAIGSVASVAFEAITGKSPEDTVLAMFKHDDAAIGVANAKVQTRMAMNNVLPDAAMPSLPQDVASKALPDGLELAALTQSLSAKGVDGETASRALYAYRRVMGMNAQPVPVVASLN